MMSAASITARAVDEATAEHALAEAIDSTFGGFDAFKQTITQNGVTNAKTDQVSARTVVLPNNFYAAYDDGRPVGTTASFGFELTIPGGVLPAAGVTWVAVQPSHRRRGILRQFMQKQLVRFKGGKR